MCPASHGVRHRVAVVLLMTMLCGLACQAWHTEPIAPESLLGARQPTTLRITRIDGTQIALEDPVLRGDTLSGVSSRQKDEVRIPLPDVRQLATRTFSAGRTMALGVGVAAP